MSVNLEILYEDHHLVAVLKPAKIPVASESSGDETLLEMVRLWNQARQAPGKKGYCVPIHFLDRPVSGVVLFGLSSKGATRLNELFRSRKIQKTYLAVTTKYLPSKNDRLIHWLAKDSNENRSFVVKADAADGKKCELSYRVLSRGEHGSDLIEVNPVTGRSHQIRAQMAATGAPLYGDVKYGAGGGWDGKIGLHAASLEFKHPVGGTELRILAPVPSYWKEIWPGTLPEDNKFDVSKMRGVR